MAYLTLKKTFTPDSQSISQEGHDYYLILFYNLKTQSHTGNFYLSYPHMWYTLIMPRWI